MGVTNQRETTVVWDPKTGKPHHNAIVWNCARTRELAAKYAKALGGQDGLRDKTGLPIVSYFSALKLVRARCGCRAGRSRQRRWEWGGYGRREGRKACL